MDTKEPTEAERKKHALIMQMFSFTTELAFVLAIPLLVFIFLGKYLDQRLGTNHFAIIGIFISLAISGYWIYRRLKMIKDQLTKK
ncbi:MAG: AtpZ/AtpI family protein [Candidatus Doudnabacteria bacterium]|nr:AtpZ/AtpI family protein [Candidatus Doudnabacteria bacterium]